MGHVKALLSDADGTLVDTVHLIRRGLFEASHRYLVNHGLSSDEIPDYLTYEKHLQAAVGGNARRTIEQTLRNLYKDTPSRLDGVDFDEMYALVDPLQDELAGQLVGSYPGSEQGLKQIGERGIKLGIVTAGTAYHVVRNFSWAFASLKFSPVYLNSELTALVKLEKLERRMEQTFGISQVSIVTCEDVSRDKPDPEGMQLAAQLLQVSLSSCAALGDYRLDMEAAKLAGIPRRIGITHGFDDEAALTSAGATDILHGLAGILSVL
jgi:phosphoglycolate phosphatase-like HAD superfamily hydrolase